MTKLRAVSVADGSIGWPEVLEYELRDGTRVPVPPRETPYRTIIHDKETYERLYLAGHIYGPPHRPITDVFDDRPAPGGVR